MIKRFAPQWFQRLALHLSLSYRQLVALSVVISLVISLGAGLWLSSYLRHIAISDLARVDARKSSLLAFQALYSGMERGWTRDDLTRIVGRLNNLEPGMIIRLHRSEPVRELFGAIADDQLADAEVIRALRGEEVWRIDRENSNVRYLYPVTILPECLRCHTNTKPGDVAGVIDVSYPATNLKISLESIFNLFLLFFAIFLVLVYLAFYMNVDRLLVRPIQNFSRSLRSISASQEDGRRIELGSIIREIQSLEGHFNKLLENEERQNEKERAQFFLDQHTNLPNRLRLKEDIAKTENPALLLFNIDGFKEINDFYGIHTGDAVLIALGIRLGSALEEGEGLYKLSGDEYAVLFACNPGRQACDLDRVQQRLGELISAIEARTFRIGNEDIALRLTGGASMGNDNPFECADMALKEAKRLRQPSRLYDDSIRTSQQFEHNLRWTRKVKSAIDDARIVPFFQPILQIQNNRIEKYEALARLIEPDGHVVPPYQFLDVAKKSKLYPHLTQSIFLSALKAFANKPQSVSINLSVEDIQNEETRQIIIHGLKTHPHPQRVCFELLESEGIENFEEVRAFIEETKRLGAKIAIDDFGTGYSNFAYLMKLHVDFIKIDASMIRHIHEDHNAQVVVETIVRFANRMGVETIAEYVHSQEVWNTIRDLGVDYAQGYFIGEPQRDV